MSRLCEQLNDVQRECASLLDDNQKLNREKSVVENEMSEKTDVIQQMRAQLHDYEEQRAKVIGRVMNYFKYILIFMKYLSTV